MEVTVSRMEHEEFARRIDSENERLSKRISVLENGLNEIHTLTVSVEKLATNMENMVKELESQGRRLEALEDRDGEKWRNAAGYVLTAVIGIVLGAVFKAAGMR